MIKIEGGICAAKGYKANAVHCGIRKNREKKDLSIIVSDVKCSAASVYTLNLVKGAPIYVTQNNIKNGNAQAIICNSGNANTCNIDGIEIAEKMCELVEKYSDINKTDVIVASTGVIGQKLSIEPIANGMEKLFKGLGNNSKDAAEGIMTTDTILKEIAYSFKIGDKECKIGGIAKGSGMIHPNMATMLVFITTDIKISPKMLQKALSNDIKNTFNMVSIDGDTSTNDMVSVLANGMAENNIIDSENSDYKIFQKALYNTTSYLCKMIAKDGEGATKLLECNVYAAKDIETARITAKSVITSSLFKAAMFGSDANWGRVLCAIGYSGADVDVLKIDVSFKSKNGIIDVCKNGSGIEFSETDAKNILSENEIEILINLNSGTETAKAWGCDLTYDYVKINGDYRT
jgi:glutamate N-acetyltransferase/amino-acid N-acetyltransferase